MDFPAKWNSGQSRLFSPSNSAFPQGIPIDFSASTQAMSWCSCTVFYQPNLCPHCPADLYTFKGRTALHSCLGHSVGWFVCMLASYKMKEKPRRKRQPGDKKSQSFRIVNSKKFGGCKNHKSSFTSIYSLYACSEQCSMVRVGSPVSAASHCGRASHSWGQQAPLPTHTPKKPLSVLHSTGQDFSSSLQSSFQQDGSGLCCRSWGYIPSRV